MRGWLTALVLAFLALLTGCAAPGPAPYAGPQKRSILSGRLQQFDFWYSVNPDCTSRGHPAIRAVTPPANGTLAFERGSDYPSYPDDNVRKACNKQKVPATLMYYQSNPKYFGSDSLVVEILFPDGGSKLVTYNIAVWPSLPVRISGAKPAYPPEARRQGIEGRVIALLYVDSEGNVTNVVIKLSPHDLLSEEAISTFRKWKFKPPIEEGKPVSFVGEYEVVFKLTDPIPSTEML